MGTLGYLEAFARYGAKPKNPIWAYTAKAKDGSIVFSCWSHKFVYPQPSGVMRYEDQLSRWELNQPGKAELEKHLRDAYENDLQVKLIIATPTNPEPVIKGERADKQKKEYHLREDMVGKVEEFDGDKFAIVFRRKAAAARE